MYQIFYISLFQSSFYTNYKFTYKRSDILKIKRSLASTDVMHLKLMIITVQS